MFLVIIRIRLLKIRNLNAGGSIQKNDMPQFILEFLCSRPSPLVLLGLQTLFCPPADVTVALLVLFFFPILILSHFHFISVTGCPYAENIRSITDFFASQVLFCFVFYIPVTRWKN